MFSLEHYFDIQGAFDLQKTNQTKSRLMGQEFCLVPNGIALSKLKISQHQSKAELNLNLSSGLPIVHTNVQKDFAILLWNSAASPQVRNDCLLQRSQCPELQSYVCVCDILERSFVALRGINWKEKAANHCHCRNPASYNNSDL